MRLYTDPRSATGLPSSPGPVHNGKGSQSGRSGRNRQKSAFESSDDETVMPTPEEMELLLQLRKAKLDMARAESEYLASLLESERGRVSRSMSAGSRPSSRPPMKKIIEEDKHLEHTTDVTYESASDVSSYSTATVEPEQLAGFPFSERNPFRTDGVIIDSDDEFLGHAVQRRAPPLTALYVDPDERKSKISKLKSRFKRLFRKSSDYS